MNLLGDYASSEDERKESPTPDKELGEESSLALVDLCPEVNPDSLNQLKVRELNDKRNAIAIVSEEDAAKKAAKKAHLTGKVENLAMNERVFSEQFYNYRTYGVVMNPENGGDKYLKKREGLLGAFEDIDADEVIGNRMSVYAASSKQERELTKAIKAKRVKAGDASSADYMGPWAYYEGEEQFDKVNQTNDDHKEVLKKSEEERKEKMEAAKRQEEFNPSSTFHGEALHDYKGRSYILPPQDLNIAREEINYIPKKPVHTYTGHRNKVMVAKFFPRFGHYILSGGYDSQIKIWDVYKNRQCVRTYSGHKNTVKDLSFTNDGMHFLSTGWDNRINYWDTETGQVVQTFKVPANPFCGKINPDEARQYAFLVGDVEKKVSQYDIRSGELTTTYNDHLGPVNTVTYVDNQRKFASTSDDKKVFLWEFGIPIVVKHISDPEMHAVTATDVHPNDKYFIGQASDNRVMCYDVKGGLIRLNKKKKFTGHVSSGHSCGLSISPDGQFVSSGDQEGRVFFWDWKSARVYSVLQAHSKVCIGVEWHPHEASTFLTASWDGTVKLWNA